MAITRHVFTEIGSLTYAIYQHMKMQHVQQGKLNRYETFGRKFFFSSHFCKFKLNLNISKCVKF